MRTLTTLTTLTTLAAAMMFSACDGDDTDSGIIGNDGFDFRTDNATAYSRVDRMGMPAITTALIESKDEYNQADPADDAAGDFTGEIVASLETFHTALRDDLNTFGLDACATFDGDDNVDVTPCVNQAAPLIIPDVLVLDFSQPSGFPNGRELPDQVVDITLAVALLDLSAEGQSAATLANVPINPRENDVEFDNGFPYLAEPF